MLQLVGALVMVLCASNAPQRGISVRHERVTLGVLVPRLPEPWANVDLGPAPDPLHSRVISASEVHRLVAQAMLGPVPSRLPKRFRVYRPGQMVSEPWLRERVRGAIEPLLPVGARLRNVVLNGGLVMGEGEMQVSFEQPHTWTSGRQTLFAQVQTSGAAQRVPVTLDLDLPRTARTPLVTRQQDVRIVLHLGSVTVQTAGVAQQNGVAGETVSVIPAQGTRMLRGRVVDAQTVEVMP